MSLPLAGALALALVAGYAISIEVFHGDSSLVETCVPTGRPSPLVGLSPEQFDQRLDVEERRTGVLDIRKKMAERVTGHVLEVAVGTGRNFGLYDLDGVVGTVGRKKDCAMTTFTGMDISPDMLDVAAKKILEALPQSAISSPSVTVLRGVNNTVVGGAAEFLNGKIRLVRGNALEALPPPLTWDTASETQAPDGIGGYDTIIQSFGLCSVSDPDRLVRNLVRAVKPGTGRVILVEHGRARGKFLNWWLDRNATHHFQKYGCWWNRDIEAVIRRAVSDMPGVEVVRLTRLPGQMNTVLWIELGVRTVQ
jgi:methyltransferase OMS1, mitochondrial